MKHYKTYILVILLTGLAGWLMAQGNAVSFDGVNDHVQVASSLGISNTYTVEGWIYPTNLGGTGDLVTFGRTVFSSSDISGSYPLWLTIYGSNIYLRTWTTSTTDRTINAGLTVNNWYHIAVTSTRGGTTRLYVNGFEVDSYTNANATTWPSTFTIGAIRPVRPTSILPYQGLIDEVRVWNTVRSAGDILTYMNTPVSPSSSGLVAYWQFDESAPGTTAFDDAGTAQNGTLANGATFVASDLTLPIELSSFTATITSQYFVQLHWVTQSETDVMGYVIFRSDVNDLASAYRASPMINATNTTTQTSYNFTDSEVTPGNWYYWLQNLDMDGSSNYFGPISVTVTDGDNETPDIPQITSLNNIYPNPFNPSTTISYGLAKAEKVNIQIYNVKGQLVHNLVSETKTPASYTANWDGRDGMGRMVATGVYVIRMQAANYQKIRKVTLMK